MEVGVCSAALRFTDTSTRLSELGVSNAEDSCCRGGMAKVAFLAIGRDWWKVLECAQVGHGSKNLLNEAAAARKLILALSFACPPEVCAPLPSFLTRDGKTTARSCSLTMCVVKAAKLTGPFAE
jgi:hypothetical protein